MINAEQIAQILALYQKHGWTLRRVLLSDQLRSGLGEALPDLFGDAPVAAAEIDAAWFSRSSRGEQEAWELRRLSETPFALVQVFDSSDDDDIREQTCRELELRMKES